MTSISARIPDSLEDQLDSYMEEEKLDRSTAVRKLISEGLEEWRREKALEMLEKGEVSFSRAAEFSEMSVWEFANLLKNSDINWVSNDRIREDLEEI